MTLSSLRVRPVMGLLLLAAWLLSVGACAQPREIDGFHLRVFPASEAGRSSDLPAVFAEIAARTAARERGLSGRTSLPPNGGMLFVYRESRQKEFWMKDCHIGLDIAFLKEDGSIASLHTLPPGAGLDEIPRAASGAPVRYVLETAAGWMAEHGLKTGDRVDVRRVVAGVQAD